jgi:hypothetical protein
MLMAESGCCKSGVGRLLCRARFSLTFQPLRHWGPTMAMMLGVLSSVSRSDASMNQVTVADLMTLLSSAEDATSAIRSIVPHYRVSEGSSQANAFIVEKTVQHFRANNKPDGVYRLGHGLELVLGERSCIQEEPPF